jgi:hypothetical protein
MEICDIDIPQGYFTATEEQKQIVCIELLDTIYEMVDEVILPEYNRFEIIKLILKHSVEHNKNKEQYEICQILSDILKLIDES